MSRNKCKSQYSCEIQARPIRNDYESVKNMMIATWMEYNVYELWNIYDLYNLSTIYCIDSCYFSTFLGGEWLLDWWSIAIKGPGILAKASFFITMNYRHQSACVAMVLKFEYEYQLQRAECVKTPQKKKTQDVVDLILANTTTKAWVWSLQQTDARTESSPT